MPWKKLESDSTENKALESFLGNNRSIEVRWTTVKNAGSSLKLDELLQALIQLPPVELPTIAFMLLLSVVDGKPRNLAGISLPPIRPDALVEKAVLCVSHHCECHQPALVASNPIDTIIHLLPKPKLCAVLLAAFLAVAPPPSKADMQQLREFALVVKSSTKDISFVLQLCRDIDVQPELSTLSIKFVHCTLITWFTEPAILDSVLSACARLLRISSSNLPLCSAICELLAAMIALKPVEVIKTVVQPSIDAVDGVLAVASEMDDVALFESALRLENELWSYSVLEAPSAGGLPAKLSSFFRKQVPDANIEGSKSAARELATRAIGDHRSVNYAAFRLTRLAPLPDQALRVRLIVVDNKQLEGFPKVLASPSSTNFTQQTVITALLGTINHSDADVVKAAARVCIDGLAVLGPVTPGLCVLIASVATTKSGISREQRDNTLAALLDCGALSVLSTVLNHGVANDDAIVERESAAALRGLLGTSTGRSRALSSPADFLTAVAALPRCSKIARNLWFLAITGILEMPQDGRVPKNISVVATLWSALRTENATTVRIVMLSVIEALTAPTSARDRRTLQHALTTGLIENAMNAYATACATVLTPSAISEQDPSDAFAEVLSFYTVFVVDSTALDFMISSHEASGAAVSAFFDQVGVFDAQLRVPDRVRLLARLAELIVPAGQCRVRGACFLPRLLTELQRCCTVDNTAISVLELLLTRLLEVTATAPRPVVALLSHSTVALQKALLELAERNMAPIDRLASHTLSALLAFSAPMKEVKALLKWALSSPGLDTRCRALRSASIARIFTDACRRTDTLAPRTHFAFHQDLGEPGLWSRFGPAEAQRVSTGVTMMMWVCLSAKSIEKPSAIWRLKCNDVTLDCFVVDGVIRLRSSTGSATRYPHNHPVFPQGVADETTSVSLTADRWYLLIFVQDEGGMLRPTTSKLYVDGAETPAFSTNRLKAFPWAEGGVLAVGASDETGIGLDSLYGKCTGVALLKTSLDAEAMPLIYELGMNEHVLLVHPNRTKERFARLTDPSLRASVVCGADPRFVDGGRICSIVSHAHTSSSGPASSASSDSTGATQYDLRMGTGTMSVESWPIFDVFIKMGCMRNIILPLLAATAGIQFSSGALEAAAAVDLDRSQLVPGPLDLLVTVIAKSLIQEEAISSGALYVAGKILAAAKPQLVLSPSTPSQVCTVCSLLVGRSKAFAQAVRGLLLHPGIWPQTDDVTIDAYLSALSLLCTNTSAKTRLSELGMGRTWLRRMMGPGFRRSRRLREGVTTLLCTMWSGSGAVFGESDARQALQVLQSLAVILAETGDVTHASPARSAAALTAATTDAVVVDEGDSNNNGDNMIADAVEALKCVSHILERAVSNASQLVGARGGLEPIINILATSVHREARVTAMQMVALLVSTCEEVTSVQLKPVDSNAHAGDFDLAVVAHALKNHPIHRELYEVILTAGTRSLDRATILVARPPFVSLAWHAVRDSRSPELARQALEDAQKIAAKSPDKVWYMRAWYRCLLELGFVATGANGWSSDVELLTLPTVARVFAANMKRSHCAELISDALCFLDDRASKVPSAAAEGVVARFLALILKLWCEKQEHEALSAATESSPGRSGGAATRDGITAKETQSIIGLLYSVESELFHRHHCSSRTTSPTNDLGISEPALTDSTWVAVGDRTKYDEASFCPMLTAPSSPLALAHAEVAIWTLKLFQQAPSLLSVTSPPANPALLAGQASGTSGLHVAISRNGGLRRIAHRVARVAIVAQPSIERLERSTLMTSVTQLLEKLTVVKPTSTATQALQFLRKDKTGPSQASPNDANALGSDAHLALISALMRALERLTPLHVDPAATEASPSSPTPLTQPSAVTAANRSRKGVSLLSALKQICQSHKDHIEAMMREAGVSTSKAVRKYLRSVSGKSYVDGVAWLMDPVFTDVEEYVTKVASLKDTVTLRAAADVAFERHVSLASEVAFDVSTKYAEDQASMHQRVASDAILRQQQVATSVDAIDAALRTLLPEEPIEPLPDLGITPSTTLGRLESFSAADWDVLRATEIDAQRYALSTKGTRLDTDPNRRCPFVRISPTETLRGLCCKLEDFPNGSRYHGLAPHRGGAAQEKDEREAERRKAAVVKKRNNADEADDHEDLSENEDSAAQGALGEDASDDLYDDAEEPSARDPLGNAKDLATASSAVSGGGVANDTVCEEVDLIFYMECCSAVLRMTTAGLSLTLDTVSKSYNQFVSPEAAAYVPKPMWRTFTVQLSEVIEVAPNRRFRMQRLAMELRFADRTSLMIAFRDRKAMERSVAHLVRWVRKSGTRFINANGREALKRDATRRWVNGTMSTFEYLLHVNFHSGRSVNDLTQYPVMPWVLSDYTSDNLDLTDPSRFRDLSLPVGLCGNTEKRRREVEDRYNDLAELDQVPFHYFTHYSSPAIVLHYLVRVEPFTALHVVLQSGRFDHADRMFHTVASSWAGVTRNHQDVKELIPELYAMPEIYTNRNRILFGAKQDGVIMDDVILPPWAQQDPRRFVQLMREALESTFVSEHIHEWIDLIFGYKQRGRHALEAHNLFHPHTYEPPGKDGRDALANMPEAEKRQLIDSLDNIGQCPQQVFLKRHPPRKAIRPPCAIEERRVATRIANVDHTVTRIAFMQFTDTRLVVVATNGAAVTFELQAAALVPPDPGAPTAGSVPLGVVNKLMTLGRGPTGAQLPITDADARCAPVARGAISFPSQTSPPNVSDRSAGPLRRPSACAVLATPDGRAVYIAYAGYFDNTCVMRNLHTRTELVVSTHRGRVTCITASPKMTYMVTGSVDTTVNVYRVELKQETIRITHRIEVTSHDDVITAVALCEDLDVLVSADASGSIAMHSVSTGAKLRYLEHPSKLRVDHLLILHNAYVPTICCASSAEKALHMWSLNGDFVATVPLDSSVAHWCTTADPRFVMLATLDGTVSYRYALDMSLVCIPEAPATDASSTALVNNTISCVAAHPKWVHLTASAGNNGQIRFYSA